MRKTRDISINVASNKSRVVVPHLAGARKVAPKDQKRSQIGVIAMSGS